MIKILLLRFLHTLGVISWWQYIHSHEIIILTIHGVMSPHDKSKWIPLRPQLSPELLDCTLRLLTRKYKFITLDDAIDMITGIIPVQPYSVALTFDDGNRNNLTHALPILLKYNAPATLFLSCGNTETNAPFWFDRLDYALQQIDSPSITVMIGKTALIIDNSSRENLIKSFARLRSTAKGISRHDLEMAQEIHELTLDLENQCGMSLLDINANDDWSTIMSWEEVQAAISSGLITIGSHTVDHIRLSKVDQKLAKEQLALSKTVIEEKTALSCKHFCYPNGDWNQEVADIVEQCGYHSAVTTAPGTNRVGDNQFCLHRINIPISGSDIEILASVTGFWLAAMRIKEKISNHSKCGTVE